MYKLNENDTVVVFGGTGFVGKSLIKRLVSTNAKIKIASLHNIEIAELKTYGSVGQLSFLQCDAYDARRLEEIITGATHIVNLIGILKESKYNSFEQAHVTCASNIANAACAHNIARLVHVSALSRNNRSRYAMTKQIGQDQVLASFSNATVIRPSVIFGKDDKFINLFANMSRYMPIIPLIGDGETKVQPIYVSDVADFIVKILEAEPDEVFGKVFDIAGPKQYTMREIVSLILKTTHRRRLIAGIPIPLAMLQGYCMEKLPYSVFTRDMVELSKTDSIIIGKNALNTFGIKPQYLEDLIPKYI